MPDPKTPPAVTISDDLQKKFPELIALILGSESMNDEERQYWVNILPVMTPEQIQNLKEILTNEKEQLAAIDQKYAKEIEKIGVDKSVTATGDERKKKRDERQKKEQEHKEKEDAAATEILEKIQGKGL